MRGMFLIGFISLMIVSTQCIGKINVGVCTVHIIGRTVYGAIKKGSELSNSWREDLNTSLREAWFLDCFKMNIDPSMQRKVEKFCFITSNSMQDIFDFYYIVEPGFRCVKESIFEAIEFLTADVFIEDINKQTKEFLIKEEVKMNDYVDTYISKFSSLVIEKLKLFLKNKFSQAMKRDQKKTDCFETAFSILNQETNKFIASFKEKNNEELIKEFQGNTKEEIILNVLDLIKPKFLLFDYSELLIVKFYRFLYLKSQKDFYFYFFKKTNEDCIAIEKEKNMIYKRLEIMRTKMKYNGDLNDIFVPFSTEPISFPSKMKNFSFFCENTAKVCIDLRKGQPNLRCFFSSIITDEFKLFRPIFLFSETMLYFGRDFSNKIKSEFIDYGGLFVDIEVFHVSFINLKYFFPEFLLEYADEFINSSNALCLSQIIKKEHESISDDTKKIVKEISSKGSIWLDFLHEIYRIYVKNTKLKVKLIISAREISLDTFGEIYNSFLKEIKTNKEIFIVSQDELCRNFFLKCILFKIESIISIFALTNIVSTEFEIIKE